MPATLPPGTRVYRPPPRRPVGAAAVGARCPLALRMTPRPGRRPRRAPKGAALRTTWPPIGPWAIKPEERTPPRRSPPQPPPPSPGSPLRSLSCRALPSPTGRRCCGCRPASSCRPPAPNRVATASSGSRSAGRGVTAGCSPPGWRLWLSWGPARSRRTPGSARSPRPSPASSPTWRPAARSPCSTNAARWAASSGSWRGRASGQAGCAPTGWSTPPGAPTRRRACARSPMSPTAPDPGAPRAGEASSSPPTPRWCCARARCSAATASGSRCRPVSAPAGSRRASWPNCERECRPTAGSSGWICNSSCRGAPTHLRPSWWAPPKAPAPPTAARPARTAATPTLATPVTTWARSPTSPAPPLERRPTASGWPSSGGCRHATRTLPKKPGSTRQTRCSLLLSWTCTPSLRGLPRPRAASSTSSRRWRRKGSPPKTSSTLVWSPTGSRAPTDAEDSGAPGRRRGPTRPAGSRRS